MDNVFNIGLKYFPRTHNWKVICCLLLPLFRVALTIPINNNFNNDAHNNFQTLDNFRLRNPPDSEISLSDKSTADRMKRSPAFARSICNDLKGSKKPPSEILKEKNLTWTESAMTLIPALEFGTYNRMETPGQAKGVTTLVKVAFYIESMSTFRSQSMDFEVDTYLALSWYDHRLAHNCSSPILITDVSVSQMLWQPDLYFVNSKFGFIHQVTTHNSMIMVYSDGFVFRSQRVNILLSCLMELQDFPMDQQNCSALIQSFAYVSNVMRLEWHVDEGKGFPIGYNPNLKRGLSDMFLIGEGYSNCYDAEQTEYPLFRGWGNWSCLRATIVMKRKLRYHLIQMFLPTAMLVCISWLSFWLDIRASPARISLTITTLLTLTTMSNGSRQDLPQVSYMKSIDKWVAACQGFVFGVLLEYTCVSYFAGYKNSECMIHIREHTFKNEGCPKLNGPSFITTEIRKACPVCAVRFETYAKRVDRVSRALFPLGFGLFNACYWWSYYDQWVFYATQKNDPNEQ